MQLHELIGFKISNLDFFPVVFAGITMMTLNWDDYDDCYHLDNEDDGNDWMSEIIIIPVILIIY